MCISQYQIVFPFGITHAINVRDEAEQIAELLMISPNFLRSAFTFLLYLDSFTFNPQTKQINTVYKIFEYLHVLIVFPITFSTLERP